MATGKQIDPVSEITKCLICLEPPRVLKTLPCQHAFCKQCIFEYFISTKERKENQNLACPVCRSVLTPPGPGPNIDISNYVDSLLPISRIEKSEVEDQVVNCDTCHRAHEKNPATKWCRDCQEVYCDRCCTNHSLFKLFLEHTVSPIRDMESILDKQFLCEISDKCSHHPKEMVEAYCIDHNQLCCVSCLTKSHRGCEKVYTVKELVSDGENPVEKIGTIEADLSKMRTAAISLLEEKKQEKIHGEETFRNIEEETKKSVQKIKDNIDTLMISFRKELDLKQDEYELGVDHRINQIENLTKYLDKVAEKINFVRTYGTPTKLFVYLEKVKEEFKQTFTETLDSLTVAMVVEVKVVIEDVFRKMETLSNIGTVNLVERKDEAISKFILELPDICCTQYTFDAIRVSREKIIETGDDIRGGTYATGDTFFVGDYSNNKVSNIDVSTGQTISEHNVTSPKRLSFKEATQILFISCSNEELHRVEYDVQRKKISDFTTIKKQPPIAYVYNGGVCNNGTSFFTIVEQAVFENEELEKSIFQTNTDCKDLNGLAYDKYNNRFVYTSKNFEVVCVSEAGEVIFKYKDKNMKEVTSVAIGLNGVIFAGDEVGRVHVISEDGKQRKTLIDKCEKVERLCDVWIDKEAKRLFVCGDKFVEIYTILRA